MQRLIKNPVSIFTLICLVLIPYLTNAQYFAVGQDPASIKWRQIQTDNFQIIYPSDFEIQAQRAAHIFEKVYKYSGSSLQNQPKKISVILHSKTLKSNGFVAWAPSRVELYPTPGQEIYSQDWIEQLAIHELRHHVQIDKIESELPKIFKILLGEQAASLVIGAYLPFWFLEGDAVVSETALSQAGRGRLPSFSMELKAQVNDRGIYSFDKAYLGSYKDYIPDYYQLGYQMVSNIRNQNGGEVWSKVLHHIARNPLGLNSLSKGLKLATGKNQDEYYLSIMKNLKSTNPIGIVFEGDTTDARTYNVKSSNFYTSYKYPYFVDDSSIVALKTSIVDIPKLVLVKNNHEEKKLFTPGTILQESMSYAYGKVIWIESNPDIRWTHKERSLMRILDIHSGELREKIFEEKLFAPVISPDGEMVAAVKFDQQNLCSIVLITISNLMIIKEIKANNFNTFFTPSWSNDQMSLYVVELSPDGKSIVQISLSSMTTDRIISPTFGDFFRPIQRNNYLYYSSNLSGKNEGYALDLTTKKSYRILTAKYGLKDLQSSEDGNTLLFADYTSNGFKIGVHENSMTKWSLANLSQRFQDTLSNKLTAQESGIIDFSTMDTSHYESKKYHKINKLINIHSWSPFYIDPDQSTVSTGFSIISQNKLTTAITQFGYNYSNVNHTGKWIGKFEYAGWFPIFRLYSDYGKENENYFQINKHYDSKNVLVSQDTVLVPYSQKALNIRADISIPLNLTHGKMYRMIQPEIQIGYSYLWQDAATPSGIFRGSYQPLTYRIYAYNLLQESARDIQSRWGQVIDIKYRHTPIGDKQLGKIFSLEGTQYLPGFLANHGLKFYGGYQQKISSTSNFSDQISYPRGYSSMNNNRLMTFRSDYVLPVISPDFYIRRFYYLKRITLRLHYDFAQLVSPVHQTTNTIKSTLSSTGATLLTECHFLRFIAPVTIGVRESYLIESKLTTSEFILSINLKGM